METENEKAAQVAEDLTPGIVIAGKVEVEGHQLVSKKLLEVTNHILTENHMLKDSFELKPGCINKIRFLADFTELGEENEGKLGMFKAEGAEIFINLQGHFDWARDCVKEDNNLAHLCIRAHLWFQMLKTLWHEIMHAISYAIDPEETTGEDREVLEEIISEQSMDELSTFVRDIECEPVSMADEPFFGIRFMEFVIKEVKDNAEDWALAQNSIHQYNERNNMLVIWKDGDTIVKSFRQWFKVAYGHHTWDDDPVEKLAELKFSLATPTTVALEAPVSDEQQMEEEMERKATKYDESPLHTGDEDILAEVDASPFHEGDTGAKDREALVGGEMAKKTADEDVLKELVIEEEAQKELDILAASIPDEHQMGYDLPEKEDDLAIPDDQVETVPEEAEAKREAIAETHTKEVMDVIHAAFPEASKKLADAAADEVTVKSPVDTESVAFQNSEEEDPGDFDADDTTAAQPGLDAFPSPELDQPAAPPAAVATGTPLPTVPPATPEPTFAPTHQHTGMGTGTTGPESAPPAGVAPQPTSPQSGYQGQKLRTGLPNHNFTGEQMRNMCEQVFLRCVNHLFAKCGWTPGGNPPFVPELRGAVMEPISMSGIPGIENFLIGMDIIDATSGAYVINSPATSHNGMVKGKVTQKAHLPSYTLYFNYNGIEIKRFICPQNQWKTNAQGYSAPAQRAQQGAQIAWIMDGDDSVAGNKWRAKVENGVIEWLV